MASQFSAFAPSGIRFTRRKPRAQIIYETLKAQWGSLFTDDPTAAINVETFAQAKCIAIAHEQLERAGNQANPRHCTELLPKLEADYRITPLPGATIAERRAALIAARAVRGGAQIDALRDGLAALLGTGLIAIVPQAMGAIGTGGMYPDTLNPHVAGPGNFAPLGAPFRVVELTSRAEAGTRTVGYIIVYGSQNPLIVGEIVTMEPQSKGIVERVTVTASTVTTFTAAFAHPHESGVLGTTAAIPYWETARRFVYVVVSGAVLTNQLLVQRANDFLRKALTHATGWALVSSSGTGTSGPFTIGTSVINETPIAQVTY